MRDDATRRPRACWKCAYERIVAEQRLLYVLGTMPSRTPKEMEPIVPRRKTWSTRGSRAARRGLPGRLRTVCCSCSERGATVPDAVRERILAEKDPERQQLWLERAVVMTSLAEVLGEPS